MPTLFAEALSVMKETLLKGSQAPQQVAVPATMPDISMPVQTFCNFIAAEINSLSNEQLEEIKAIIQMDIVNFKARVREQN